MSKQIHPIEISEVDVRSAVVDVLERATKPLSVTQLGKEIALRCKPSKALLQAVLVALKSDGKAFVWGTPKTPSYWNKNAATLARAAILDGVKNSPAARAALESAAKKSAPGISKKVVDDTFAALLSEKSIFEHPAEKKGGKPVYATVPYMPPLLDDVIVSNLTKNFAVKALLAAVQKTRRDTTEAELLAALQRLYAADRAFPQLPRTKKDGPKWGPSRPELAPCFKGLDAIAGERSRLLGFGFSAESIDAAIRSKLPPEIAAPKSDAMPDDLAERILLVVRATRQPLLSLPELRLLMNRPKPEFDAAVLRLRDAGRVRLHSHDHPYGMSDDKRYELVADSGDRFYVGIAVA